jgi:ABC-2 type transport system permease protein
VSITVALQTLPARSRRMAIVTWAFIRMGAIATLSYPLAFVLLQVSSVLQVVAFVFLAHLTVHSADLGSGYLAFAAIGLAAGQTMSGGILGLGQELDWAIQQGRLEMILIEPVSWRLIPVALAAWPTLYRVATGVVIFLGAWAFGAIFTFHDMATVVGLVVLGVAGGLVIGLFAAGLRVLAKRGDPIAAIYAMATYVVSGQFVPINVYPLPLRVAAWFFPNTYVYAGLRKALEPNASHVYGPDPAQAMLLLLAFSAVLLPLALWLFGRTLQVGRRYGVLAGY